MPMPRTGQRRYKHWETKQNATVISTRWTDELDYMKEMAQEGLIPFADLDLQIGSILNAEGIAGPMRATYLAFARKVAKASYRLDGRALELQILGLKQYFQLSYGADPTVLDKIINAIIGYVPTY